MPYSETGPITTRDVIDAIRDRNLDGARDKTQELLYKKSGEAVVARKLDIANSIAKPDVTADVVDFTEPATEE